MVKLVVFWLLEEFRLRAAVSLAQLTAAADEFVVVMGVPVGSYLAESGPHKIFG
jgi:hypothetical protein